MRISSEVGEKIHITDGYIYRNEYGIIECMPDPDAELTVEKYLEAMEVMEKMTKGKRELILLTTHPRNSMSKDARDLDVTNRKMKYTLAHALVVSSMSTLILGNFYIRVKRFPFPYRIFKDRQKAIDWLLKKQLESKKK